MSEKGQGEESAEGTGVGTGVGIDATPPGGGGSQADQSGPPGESVSDQIEQELKRREAARDQIAVPTEADKAFDDLGLGDPFAAFDNPDLAENFERLAQDANATEQGGTVADDIRKAAEAFPAIDDDAAAEIADDSPETAAGREERLERDRDAHDRAMNEAMARQERERAESEGPQVLPPDLTSPQEGESGSESVLTDLPPDENKPVMS